MLQVVHIKFKFYFTCWSIKGDRFHVRKVRQIRNIYIGKLKVKKSLGRARCRWGSINRGSLWCVLHLIQSRLDGNELILSTAVELRQRGVYSIPKKKKKRKASFLDSSGTKHHKAK